MEKGKVYTKGINIYAGYTLKITLDVLFCKANYCIFKDIHSINIF